jgi:hypothetical protein
MVPVQIAGDRTDMAEMSRLDVIQKDQSDLTTMDNGTFSRGARLQIETSLVQNLGVNSVDNARQAREHECRRWFPWPFGGIEA